MSQHRFASSYKGQLVVVQIGWDRPLQCCYMVVTKDDVGDRDEEDDHGDVASGRDDEIVYDNIRDRRAGFGIQDPTYYWLMLETLQIACVHQSVIDEEIRSDQAANVGNRDVWYGPGGAVKDTPGNAVIEEALVRESAAHCLDTGNESAEP